MLRRVNFLDGYGSHSYTTYKYCSAAIVFKEDRPMLDKMFEQAQNVFKPMNELLSLNSKVMEELAEKQKSLVTDMVNESMAFAKEIGSQKDFSGVYQTQKTYVEGLQEKMVAASTEAYEIFTTTQEKAGEVIKSAAVVQ
jgi:phasin family protein